MNIEIKIFYGKEIDHVINELAKLRIEVFFDYPYLYEGDFEYEKKYLEVYLNSKKSVLVAAYDGNKIIGAATALPLLDEADYVIEPFKNAEMNLSEIYYFGESVLKKEYRGLGLGHKFFDGRENAALKFGYNFTTFCGVVRQSDHPKKPLNYRPLDEFWMKRGYTKQENLKSFFSWKDIGDETETKKPMTYWMRKWN